MNKSFFFTPSQANYDLKVRQQKFSHFHKHFSPFSRSQHTIFMIDDVYEVKSEAHNEKAPAVIKWVFLIRTQWVSLQSLDFVYKIISLEVILKGTIRSVWWCNNWVRWDYNNLWWNDDEIISSRKWDSPRFVDATAHSRQKFIIHAIKLSILQKC